MTEDAIRLAVLYYARAGFGRGMRSLKALRATGDIGLGGVWQCYVPATNGSLSSYGPNLHATSDGVVSTHAPRAGHPRTTGSKGTAPIQFRVGAADRAALERIGSETGESAGQVAHRLTLQALDRL